MFFFSLPHYVPTYTCTRRIPVDMNIHRYARSQCSRALCTYKRASAGRVARQMSRALCLCWRPRKPNADTTKRNGPNPYGYEKTPSYIRSVLRETTSAPIDIYIRVYMLYTQRTSRFATIETVRDLYGNDFSEGRVFFFFFQLTFWREFICVFYYKSYYLKYRNIAMGLD